MTTAKTAVLPAPKKEVAKENFPAVELPSIKPISLKENSENLQPLEDRLTRLSQLFELQNRYNKLLDAKQKLADFDLNTDTEATELTLYDKNNRGREFSTKNQLIIKDVIGCIKFSIDIKLKEIEPLLKW